MANKQMNQLSTISEVAASDLMLIYDISEAGSEKAKSILFSDFESGITVLEDSPIDTRVTWWDDAAGILKTQGDTYITVNSGTQFIHLSTTDSSHDLGQIKLDGDNNRGTLGSKGINNETYFEVGEEVEYVYAIMNAHGLNQIKMTSDGTNYWRGEQCKITLDDTALSETGSIIFTVNDWNNTELTIDDNGISLASGASVNEIETTLTDDDTHLPTSGAVFDYVDTVSGSLGGSVDKIEEGNSSVEVIDTGTGEVSVVIDGTEKAEFTPTTQRIGDLTEAYLAVTATDDIKIHATGNDTFIEIIDGFATIEMRANSQQVFLADAGQPFVMLGDWETGNDYLQVDLSSSTINAYAGGVNVFKATSAGLQLSTGASVNEIETTLTDDDTHLPTSGAVKDYVDTVASGVNGWFDDGTNFRCTVEGGIITAIGSSVAGGFNVA